VERRTDNRKVFRGSSTSQPRLQVAEKSPTLASRPRLDCASLLESDGAISDSKSDISVMVTRRSRRRHGLVRQQTFSIVPTSAIRSSNDDDDTVVSPSLVPLMQRPVSAGFASSTERRVAGTAIAANLKRPLSGPPTALKSPKPSEGVSSTNDATTSATTTAAVDFRRHSHASCHNQRASTTTPTLGRKLDGRRGGGGRGMVAAMTSPPRLLRLF
jgi:hypothetical protein